VIAYRSDLAGSHFQHAGQSGSGLLVSQNNRNGGQARAFGLFSQAAFTGALNDRWNFDFEARYLDAGNVSMDSERGDLDGRIDADYSLFEVIVEATFRF
jgi:hypothetical protein